MTGGGCAPADVREPSLEERLRWQAEHWEERYREKMRQIGCLVRNLPEMETKEGQEDEWKRIVEVNKDDGYSRAVTDVAEMTARVLQVTKGGSEDKDELLFQAVCLVDPYGITGFQADCVYSILKRVWKYSDEFFREVKE